MLMAARHIASVESYSKGYVQYASTARHAHLFNTFSLSHTHNIVFLTEYFLVHGL